MVVNLGTTLSKGVAWTSASAALGKFIGIAYVLLVLSHLSVYEYGVVELLLTIPPLLAIITLPGLDPVLTADIAKERGDGNRRKMRFLLESYFVLRLFLGCIAFSILFFGSTIVEQFYNQAIGSMVQVLAFTFLFSPFRSLYLVTFRVGLEYKQVAYYRFFEELGKLIVVAAGLIIFDLGPLAVILAYVSADVLSLSLMTPVVLKVQKNVFGEFKITDGWRNPLYTIKAHGKWSIFGTYLEIFGQNIRPWIIKFTLGTQAVGIYAVALGMYQNTISLIPVGQVAAPIIPQYLRKERLLHQIVNSALKYQLLAVLFSGVVMLALMPILVFFFFPEYAVAYPLFACLLLTGIPASFSSVLQPVFYALKAQKNLFFANILRLITIVIFLPLFTFSVGLYGIAIEFFLTRAIYSYTRYKKLRSLLPAYKLSFKELASITQTDRLLYKQVKNKISYFPARLLRR